MNKIGIASTAVAGLMATALAVAVPHIEEFEGTEHKAYRDVVGVLTVCAGHTGPDIVVGKVYSPSECKALTERDAKTAIDGVLRVSPHLQYHPMQLAAAISFSYNVGTGTYSRSSVARLFNEGNFVGACNFLLKYTYAGGKYVQGLANRRAKEHAICMSTLTVQGVKNVGISS